jgi:hypothetical protein
MICAESGAEVFWDNDSQRAEPVGTDPRIVRDALDRHRTQLTGLIDQLSHAT